MDRIEFEELALKSMDPSLGPDLSHWRSRKSESELKKGDYVGSFKALIVGIN